MGVAIRNLRKPSVTGGAPERATLIRGKADPHSNTISVNFMRFLVFISSYPPPPS
jgi:hypothetical protein